MMANYFAILSRKTQQFLNTLFSPICLICGFSTHTASNLCQTCQQSLPILPHHCQFCAQFLPSTTISICGKCQQSRPPFDKVYAIGPYAAGIKQLIRQLKFQQQLTAAEALGILLVHKIQTVWYQHQRLPDLILPIPLHVDRLKERGFNQAIEIARPIQKHCQLPMHVTGISRTKPTLAQSGLTYRQRQANMLQAFEINDDYSGYSIALLDDVMTTGSTLRACSAALKQHGVKRIDIWCCARRG